MNVAQPTPGAGEGTAPVLALCDAGSRGRQACWRAALVAREWGTHVRLLQVVPRAAQEAAALESLEGLVRELRDELGVAAQAQVVAGDVLHEARRAAQGASLVVIAPGARNPLREWVMGTQAERLIRLLRVPVLVVKQSPADEYQRVLVPVDLAPGSAEAVRLAATLSRRPDAIEVLHAVPAGDGVTLRAGDAPEAAVRMHGRQVVRRAQALVQRLIASVGADGLRANPWVAQGDAAALVVDRARALRADVVVIGKRRRGMLADFFLGSVTQRVLARVDSDVLVLTVDSGRTQAVPPAPALRPEG